MDRLLLDSRMGPIAFRDTLRAPTSERPLLAASRLGNTSASLTRAIKSTVAKELTEPFVRGTVTYAGYGALLDALQDPAVDAIEVFTLNHDCLLEATLDHHGVDYTVVVPGAGNHSYGRGGAEPSPEARLRIVKVHGSVSWGIKREPGEQLWDRLRRLGFEAVGTAGKGEPVILVGRFNKMTDQANQVLFLDLLHAFREGLAGVRHLVVSGYGFSDKNVNTLLLEWLSWEDERKAVVVHKNRKELLGSARPAVAGRPDLDSSWIGGLEAAERRRKLRFHPHWFQDTSWAELKDVLEFGGGSATPR